MKTSFAKSALLAFVFVLQFACAIRSAAYHQEQEPVNPLTHHSPSGEFVCEIDPSDMYGRGEALYKLLHKGSVIWEGQKPFTFQHAGVTDDGFVVGFAYTQGEDGFHAAGIKGGLGQFVVAMIDPAGTTHITESVKREASLFPDDWPNPLAAGLILDAPNNRFIVRVRDTDINRRRESWWIYELRSAKALGKFNLSPGDGGMRTPVHAVPVLGTPLILLHYWRFEATNMNARFALIDQSLREVWSTTWRQEYNMDGVQSAERLRERILAEGAILETTLTNHFELLSIKTSERVAFSVRRDPKIGQDTWSVTEVARNKYFHPLNTNTPTPPIFKAGKSLKLLGAFTFGDNPQATNQPFRNLFRFGFDDKDRLGLLRRDKNKNLGFVMVDSDGRIICEKSLAEISAQTVNGNTCCAWLEGKRWVIASSQPGPDGKTAIWWLDALSGKLEAIPGLKCPSITKIIGSGDGGFIALTANHHSYTIDHELIAFDKSGRIRWRTEQFSPEDVTLGRGGQIAVLDSVRAQIDYFDSNGKRKSTLELRKALGRKANYPIGISAEKSGDFLIHDFHGSPPIVILSADGRVLSQFTIKHRDGRVIDPTFGVKTSPSGRVWACDGDSLVRLDGKGVADLVLGLDPSSAALGSVSAVTIDQQAQLYAADQRNGNVHVFDKNGTLIKICTADPSDFSKMISMPSICVTERGEIFVGHGDNYPNTASYIHFAQDGRRLGLRKFGLDKIGERLYSLPSAGRFLVLGYHDAFIINTDGKVLRKIQRRPDRTWLAHPSRASVAPDGSFAILTNGREGTRINLYSTDGEPIRTIVLPSDCLDYSFAFTGKYLAICTEAEIRIFGTQGEPVLSFRYPLEQFENHWWQCYCTQGELWMVSQGLKKVYRFELPQ